MPHVCPTTTTTTTTTTGGHIEKTVTPTATCAQRDAALNRTDRRLGLRSEREQQP